ncbi:hypothetical protein RDWZM_006621 [Blomia tropicalis]|uniref:Cleavage stimulation factor subunit 1 dimerisation domain-containing protein n=1 Tax=Blomia tropicalis TaxID=40697 RepID=A0A9Q0RNI1_BLOTA|nr:hypothetical protein RDWZM_006621 [Blomia tropicalis]
MPTSNNDDSINVHNSMKMSPDHSNGDVKISNFNTNWSNTTNHHQPIENMESSTQNSTLVIDDLFIGQTLNQICPNHFTKKWLSSVKQCYLSSFNTKPESKYIEQLDTFPGAPNRFLSYVSFEGRNENKLSNNFTNCSVHVRDCVLYLKNLSDILSTIGQYYVTINPTANNSNLMSLSNLVNSLANFDLNSSQVMLDTNELESMKMIITNMVPHGLVDSNVESESLPKLNPFFPSSNSNNGGVSHFYQTNSVTSITPAIGDGESDADSNSYGRSSTASNSSVRNGCTKFGSLNTTATETSNSLFRSNDLNILNQRTQQPIGSTAINDSFDSCSFLDTQMAAVTADLCDLTDMPKLISANDSMASLVKATPKRVNDLAIYGGNNSSPFNDLNQSLLDSADSNHSDFFGELNQILFNNENRPAKDYFTSNGAKGNFTIAHAPPVGSNQCFTIEQNTGNDDEQSDLMDKRTATCFNEAQSKNSQRTTSRSANGDPIVLCDKDLFYRLIIGQLLFNGHRSIANQLAIAERIKADGSLLSPSDRLHTLVSTAIRREIDLLSINPSPDIVQFGPQQNTANIGKDKHHQSMRLDEQDNYHKSLYDVSQNQNDYVSSSLSFNSNSKMDSNDVHGNLDFDVPLDHDVYGSTEMYYSNGSSSMNASSTHSNNNGSNLGILKQMSHPPTHHPNNHSHHGLMQDRSQTSQGMRSNVAAMDPVGTPLVTKSPPIVLDYANAVTSNGTGSSAQSSATSNGSASISPGFMLNENAMKNLNHLATKLNEANASSIPSIVGNGPIFGRCASAMAIGISGNQSQQTPQSNSPFHGSQSRSQANINGSKTSLVNGLNNLTLIGPSHTTGNGKNHKIMQIRSKFGSLGSQSNQFSSPHGFCLANEEIVIADTNNHRICVYEKNGTFKHSFGTPGKDEGQLWYPRKITMICSPNVRNTASNPYYVICDRGMERSRMQIFTRNGNFVRKIPIRYIDIVAGIAVNAHGQIVTVDSVSPTIFIISESGDLLEWFDCSDHMREPSDIAIYQKEYYICDFKGHCVVVFSERGKCLRKIGMESLTSFPNGIDISGNGQILVGDSHGNRFHVAIFNQEGKLLSEYECPYVKVSRCCGLKLTSEGYVVTLAKNNHHVLVLNTLYT